MVDIGGTPHKPLRVMWLLNHTTLRQFESQRLKELGVTQIFTPKRFPYDEGNLSATVTYEFDNELGLSPDQMALLNNQDWYAEPAASAWDIANAHFDVVFIGFFPRQMLATCRNFRGAIVLRAFGLGGEETYSKLISKIGGPSLQSAIMSAGKRFWFGMGYQHLADCEEPFIADRAVHMPVGLNRVDISDQWNGDDKSILFVCPRIGSSPYFNKIYRDFREDFKGLRYRIGGAQPIAVTDKNVLGFVSATQYSELMKQSRVMFYHSREPNHIHYHPFEAIRAGMPLVFMAGGLLDRMGGSKLPGRCDSVVEARRKIEAILNGDWGLIRKIRSSQVVLLEAMSPESCGPAWREGVARIAKELEFRRIEREARPSATIRRRKRVAVVLPVAYRGGSLRGALALASALHMGSRQCNEDADVVFAHLDESGYADHQFEDLSDDVARRPFRWKIMTPAEANRAMRYAGYPGWESRSNSYMAPDDGMRQLLDCDLWLIVSDRMRHPILPLRPIVLMVFDYLQRYVDLLSHGADMSFLSAARSAERVLVTTEFTSRDAVQYAGIDPRKVHKVPMLAPDFPIRRLPYSAQLDERSYFIWTTNSAPHKNHRHAVEALRIYYEELEGEWDCRITGVDSKGIQTSDLPHLKSIAGVFAESRKVRRYVKFLGELPDARYRQLLSQAGFLWHAGLVDNGTFSVIEAACLGVPSLSSDYPAMRELDAQFSLNLAWMNPDSPRDMAKQLKTMESEAIARRDQLPTEAQLSDQRIKNHAGAYWEEVRACL